ncbi:hypothetical protein [Candidatus Colwellia aromaticivorans]|uniref:hypothetical protein n=1 Tax=Candidatus Colwellia aromaticivorans TaxID=2267621 RepID=UPI000DF22BE1|nr:hypothetical protein [Candidatus Colwellia aromaticivorans]
MKFNTNLFLAIVIVLVPSKAVLAQSESQQNSEQKQENSEPTEQIQMGEWSGKLFDRMTNLYNLAFIVKFDQEELAITMINLDLDPTPEYTYKLKNINLKHDSLSFSIPDEYDKQDCMLEKEGNDFIGYCQSTDNESSKKSKLTMVPPPK